MHTLIFHVCRCISLLLTARKMLGFVILVWLFPRVFEQTSYQRLGVRSPWLWHLRYHLNSNVHLRQMPHAACVQNNLAGILCQCRGCTDAGPLFRWFHWLPVMQWVTCKVAVTAYKVWVRATPACLSERPGANPHAGRVTAVIWCSTDSWTYIDLAQVLPRSWLPPLGTLSLLKFGYATAMLHSNDTKRHIHSLLTSHFAPPSVTLCLWTPWRYTHAFILMPHCSTT